jgi:hypothetical protein
MKGCCFMLMAAAIAKPHGLGRRDLSYCRRRLQAGVPASHSYSVMFPPW